MTDQYDWSRNTVAVPSTHEIAASTNHDQLWTLLIRKKQQTDERRFRVESEVGAFQVPDDRVNLSSFDKQSVHGGGRSNFVGGAECLQEYMSIDRESTSSMLLTV